MHSNNFSVYFNDERKSISVNDLTDKHNDQRAFNRNTRSYKKAKALFVAGIKNGEVNGETTFWEVIKLFDMVGMKMHAYCGMD